MSGASDNLQYAMTLTVDGRVLDQQCLPSPNRDLDVGSVNWTVSAASAHGVGVVIITVIVADRFGLETSIAAQVTLDKTPPDDGDVVDTDCFLDAAGARSVVAVDSSGGYVCSSAVNSLGSSNGYAAHDTVVRAGVLSACWGLGRSRATASAAPTITRSGGASRGGFVDLESSALSLVARVVVGNCSTAVCELRQHACGGCHGVVDRHGQAEPNRDGSRWHWRYLHSTSSYDFTASRSRDIARWVAARHGSQ